MHSDFFDKELQDVREKNVELAKHLQHWKAVASEREREKLDYLKENKILRMHIMNQKRNHTVSINTLVDNFIKDLSQKTLNHLLDASNNLVRTIRTLEEYRKESLVLDYEYPSCNPRNSPTNNIQLVQPMVKGHSILKPTITLARAIIDIPPVEPSRSLETTSERDETTRPISAARPVAQLLESFVPLHRVDNEISRISDVNINIRRPRRSSFNTETCLLDVSINGNDESVDAEGGVSEMDTTMIVGQTETFNNDEVFDEGDSAGTLYSRSNLSQIVEELEDVIEPLSPQVTVNLNLDLSNCKFDLVPLVLLHRNTNERSDQEDSFIPQPGPSWQVDNSDDETTGKPDSKRKKSTKKKKKRQKADSKKAQKVDLDKVGNSKYPPAHDKENIHLRANQVGSDSDSENSNYDEKLHQMLLSKRVIDSLKPVRIIVNKLEVPSEVSSTFDSIVSSAENTTVEDSTTDNSVNRSCNLPEQNALTRDPDENLDLSPEKKRRTEASTSDINYFSRDSEDNIQRPSSRSRRTGHKDYKEKPLNKKLRRT